MPALAAGWALVLLGLALPFETLTPALRIRGVGLTGLEIVLLSAVALAALAARARPIRSLLDERSLPLLGFAALAVLSGILSAEPDLGLKAGARWAVGTALFLVARPLLARTTWRRRVLVALAASALLSSLLALGCLAGWRPFPPQAFGEGVGWYGPYARASGSFLTANTLAHFLATLLPAALALGALLPPVPALAAAALAAGTLALTLSRAALLVGLAVVLAWPAFARRYGFAGRAERGVGLAALAAILLVSAAYRPARLRLALGRLPVFRVVYHAPERIETPAGRPIPVEVGLSVSAQDALPGEGVTGLRYVLRRVAPDVSPHLEGTAPAFPALANRTRTVRLELPPAPLPGVYAVLWDAVLSGRHNMSAMGSVPATSEVDVYSRSPRELAAYRREEGALEARLIEDQAAHAQAIVQYTHPPSRLELWGAALTLIARHPWLGVGPDQFRLASRELITRSAHDPRMSAHDVFLELGATLGLPALALLALAVARVLASAAAPARPAAVPADRLRAVAGFCLLAMLAHSLIDYFLGFTAMYALFFLLLALADGGPGGA